MRQAGLLAAAGLYALDHHVDRLAEDHDNARRLAEWIRRSPHVALPAEPETNMVVFDLREGAPFSVEQAADRARERGVLISAMSARRLRVVTHLDVSADDCARAGAVLSEVLAA